MRTLLTFLFLSFSSNALAGPVATPSMYAIIAVRPVGDSKTLKAGESAEVEVVTPSKLEAVGLAGVKAGDKVTLTCIKPDKLYSVTKGRTTVKYTVEADGSVKPAK